jgi:hypothetical protein
MSTKNVALAALLAVVVGVTLSLFFHQAATERAALTRLAILAEDERKLEAEIERLRRTVAERENVARREETLASSGPSPRTPGAVIAPAPTPEQMRVNTIRAWLQLRNGPLYAKLALTAEQVASFEALETEHWLRVEDIIATARAQALRTSDPVIVALHKEERTRFDQAQVALLGEAGFNELREYQRTLPARSLANALAGNVFYSDPLTLQQGEQLIRILASNSATYTKGGPVRMADMELGTALAQVQTVLSPEQFAVFKRTYLASEAGQKLSPLLAASTKASAPAAPAAPAK